MKRNNKQNYLWFVRNSWWSSQLTPHAYCYDGRRGAGRARLKNQTAHPQAFYDNVWGCQVSSTSWLYWRPCQRLCKPWPGICTHKTHKYSPLSWIKPLSRSIWYLRFYRDRMEMMCNGCMTSLATLLIRLVLNQQLTIDSRLRTFTRVIEYVPTLLRIEVAFWMLGMHCINVYQLSQWYALTLEGKWYCLVEPRLGSFN